MTKRRVKGSLTQDTTDLYNPLSLPFPTPLLYTNPFPVRVASSWYTDVGKVMLNLIPDTPTETWNSSVESQTGPLLSLKRFLTYLTRKEDRVSMTHHSLKMGRTLRSPLFRWTEVGLYVFRSKILTFRYDGPMISRSPKEWWSRLLFS